MKLTKEGGEILKEIAEAEDNRKCSNCIRFKECKYFAVASQALASVGATGKEEKKDDVIDVEKSLAYTCKSFLDKKLFTLSKVGEQLYTR
jgi:hypothetical protein